MSGSTTDWFRAQPKNTKPAPAPAAPQTPPGPATPQRGWTKSTMPTQLPDSKQGVSAAVVMHQFARGEVRTINGQADALYLKLIARLKTRPEFQKFKDDQLRGVIKNITYRLQTADLTINFKAPGFFSTENTSTTYRQMYDRAQRDVVQADGTTKRQMHMADTRGNSATLRDKADTKVMFGKNVSTPEMQGVARFMQTGGLTATGAVNADGLAEYVANNPNFNPKARQSFTGLNYTRFSWGAVPFWGSSYFILRDALKVNAIYYQDDTFSPGQGADKRVSYGTIFALILNGKEEFFDAVLNSCYRQIVFRDVPMRLCVEVHIYEEISFSKDVKEMRISKQEVLNASRASLLTASPKTDAEMTALQQTIWDNAAKFAKRHRIVLSAVD
jgi:hypothetical protein